MKELAEKEEITAILSMHTGAQYIFVPYSDTVSKRIKRRHSTTRKQLTLANVMWAAADGFFAGTGVVYDMNDYTADGTMTDWMAGKLNVPYSITFEMYGTPGDLANCFEQFNPPGDRVQSTLERMHGVYSAAFLHLIDTVQISLATSTSLPLPFYLYLFLHLHLHLYFNLDSCLNSCLCSYTLSFIESHAPFLLLGAIFLRFSALPGARRCTSSRHEP